MIPNSGAVDALYAAAARRRMPATGISLDL